MASLGKLQAFVAEHERLPRPEDGRYQGLDLFNWCKVQQYKRRKERINKELEGELARVQGWTWEVRYVTPSDSGVLIVCCFY
jgi:hypothetical protein